MIKYKKHSYMSNGYKRNVKKTFYTANAPKFGITGTGNTRKSAKTNLKKKVNSYLK